MFIFVQKYLELIRVCFKNKYDCERHNHCEISLDKQNI